ncbi:LPXTG cell wall anchor domain-containing protein [Modestobacter sp. I12A-02628]|uniref:receptor protein-tyrosine kinase n=1 Tax=Goekera deserti TaxID=2497753 RepID=A0A7K3W8B9_9ACTN|nr:glycine-rich protein [Goekera deserti]MPQ99773.1 LPXTG cell wall anchor domain-containing protein [Goekera deserti]NDI49532.1 LPXTG cell wall anchor domain-containing protein [Goekera deserti]NEL52594.1 LPXTG cell wall anchor domain-containing protein [Goekera deserti]
MRSTSWARRTGALTGVGAMAAAVGLIALTGPALADITDDIYHEDAYELGTATVPDGACWVDWVVRGGSGGDGNGDSYGAGGLGGVVTARTAVTADSVLVLTAGQQGRQPKSDETRGPGGHSGEAQSGGDGGVGGGGGGGASTVHVQGDDGFLVVAGGGGGGAGSQQARGGDAGRPGAAGQPSTTSSKTFRGGRGGTAVAGGAGGYGTQTLYDFEDELLGTGPAGVPGGDGTLGLGGDGEGPRAGGGGGGYFGGGGGASSGESLGGAGGGGSSFAAATDYDSVVLDFSGDGVIRGNYVDCAVAGPPSTPTSPPPASDPGPVSTPTATPSAPTPSAPPTTVPPTTAAPTTAAPTSPVAPPSTPPAAQQPVVPPVPPVTPLTLTTDRGVITEIDPGQALTVVGTGFLPFSTATIVIYSTPIVLGDVVTDAQGNFSTTVTVPKTLEAGTHSLVASGIAPDGTSRFLRMDVVMESAEQAPAAGDGPALADTGASTVVPALLGVGLLAGGAGLLVVSRRRAG